MVNHVAYQIWNVADVHSFEWEVSNVWMDIVRWPVSVFVMISGTLFLSRDIPLRKIYGKYIFRIFTAFAFWSFIYTLLFFNNEGNFVKSISHFIWGGGYHFWFLYMIVGLYMVVPFLKKIAEAESLVKYFLVLSLIFAVVRPEIIDVIMLFSERAGSFAKNYIDKFELNFAARFSGYFLLGYILHRSKITPKLEKAIYCMGIISFILTAPLTSAISKLCGKASHIFYDNLTLNILCESIALFVFFKRHIQKPSAVIRKLAQYSFGAYLVHLAIIDTVKLCGLHSMAFNPIFSVPVISVIVFVCSFVISAVLNHIPVLKKYIV